MGLYYTGDTNNNKRPLGNITPTEMQLDQEIIKYLCVDFILKLYDLLFGLDVAFNRLIL